ncbi:hypothetical protein CTZ27_35610 [Streptomyces griseocarneus]|nr:hypothetical protein CTZ27_35610 [Streptomyces griseocarneus]
MREVVAGSLEPEHATATVALTLTEDVERLLRADWGTRRRMLADRPRLVHARVAAVCESRDPLLAMVIGRATEAGLDRALAELPVGAALLACLDTSRIPDPGPTEAAVRLATTALGTHHVPWLARLIVEVAEHTVTGATGRTLSAECRQHVLAAQAGLLGVDRACLDEAARLLETDWDEVWAELPALPAPPLELAAGAEVWVRHLALFAPGVPTGDWATDLRDLLRATAERGPASAAEEHRLVLEAREARQDADRTDPQWLTRSAETVNGLLGYWSQHRAEWVLGHAVALARAVADATPDDHLDRAVIVGDLGNAIAEQVQASLAPASDLEQALTCAYEAVRLTPPGAAGRGTFAANLGYRIGLAVDTGLRPTSDLREAIDWQREALDAAPVGDARRPLRASMLASRISEAVREAHGTLDELREAVALAEEAVDLSGDDPDHHMYEINLALLLSEAVETGVCARKELARAVVLARRALDGIPNWHPARPGYLSSASAVLDDAVNADVEPAESLEDALTWLRESVEGTSADHPHYASRLSGLSSRITHAVLTGICPAAGYVEAVRLARLALEHTLPGHPGHPELASNLGAVVEEAVRFGVLPASTMAEARQAAREAWESSPEDAPARIGYASNLATLLAAGRRAEDYDEALKLARDCVEQVPGSHPGRTTYLSNLSSLIIDRVREGVAQTHELTEAIEMAERALDGTAETSSRRAAHESNLATAMGLAVQRGVVAPERLADVLRLATAAVDRTPAAHPDRAVYLTNLMLALEEAVTAGVLTRAEAAHRALEVITGFRQLVLYSVSSPVQREAVLRTCEGLVSVATPLVAVGAGPAEGIRVAEGVRNLATSAERLPDLTADAVPSGLLSRFQAAVEAHRDAQQRFASGLDDLASTARSQGELTDVLTEIGRVLPGGPPGALPAIGELAAHLPEKTLAVYLVPGLEEADGEALLLDRPGAVRRVLLPGLSEERVGAWVNLLLEGPEHALSVQGQLWNVVMEPLLRAAAPLAASADWILVPVGHLSMLPVYAAGTPEEWLDDRVTVRVLPSVTHLVPPSAPPAPGDPVIATSGATDLPFLSADRAVAEHFLPPRAGSVVRVGTRDDALTGLAGAPAAVLGGHARHSLRHGAGLDLDDGPLTAEHLWRLPVFDRDVAIVTGCSSAQVAGMLVDEVIGLPSALLRAGFRGVFATTWPVADATAFITLAHLLELRRARPDLAPHLMLHEVRRTLRAVTTQGLQAWFTELTAEVAVTADAAREFERFLHPYGHGAMPLADPKDWAAFGYTGR